MVGFRVMHVAESSHSLKKNDRWSGEVIFIHVNFVRVSIPDFDNYCKRFIIILIMDAPLTYNCKKTVFLFKINSSNYFVQ